VVAAAHRQHPGALGPAGPALGLQHHLERDLDRHRTRVGEEHPVQPGRADLDQPLGETDRRCMGEAAEHHVREVVRLRGERSVEHRVVVAVDGGPPRRHPVDEPGAVGQPQAYPVGAGHQSDRRRVGHRRVGVPEVLAVEREQVVGRAGH
jgi:hypothetical protein